MDETSTKNLFPVSKKTVVKENDAIETLNADDLIFYYALRTDLSQLEQQPKPQTVHQILKYSKNLQ